MENIQITFLLLNMMVLVRKAIRIWWTTPFCLVSELLRKLAEFQFQKIFFLIISALGGILNQKDKLGYSSLFHIQ